MRAMETVQDLIEEGKIRTVWWALCIFVVTYFLSHTSKSMWMNLPVAILGVTFLRILSTEVDFRWKVKPVSRKKSYLSHLEKKQLSVNDPRIASAPPSQKKKKKIDSPIVESAISDIIDKVLKDFVVDLWYSEITPDREAPEHIRSIIMDALGEIAVRVKEINLVDLLTRDLIDLVGNHLDLFRKNQAAIGADVMRTLSTDQRDERLKYHLMASKELHPALISPESEYKVLQRLVGGIIAAVLRPREAQCPIVRTIAREIVTCLVVQPLLDLASPVYINELIECVFLALNDYAATMVGFDQPTNVVDHLQSHSVENSNVSARKYQRSDMALAIVDDKMALPSDTSEDEPLQSRPADWARIFEAATQRRTEVLTPENLENMWTKGRNYKKKEHKNPKVVQGPVAKVPRPSTGPSDSGKQVLHDFKKDLPIEGKFLVDESIYNSTVSAEGKSRLKRSSSTSALQAEPGMKKVFTGDGGGTIISEFYGPDFSKPSEDYKARSVLDTVLRSEGPHAPKLRCRVIGAYFEKLGSKSFAVYSIAVTDAENKTWFVKRRYRNFERLHRHLKDIPNYTLHLPPKRIFSSSTEDAFVHQRCIQLDKYLQDLLSIANVAEQHEVWDFLSASSKSYSFGKSSSVMRTLAVNVDDAVDDIVRQFKGVSDGLIRKVSGSVPSPLEGSSSSFSKNLSWNASDEINKHMLRQNTAGSGNNLSDNEEGDREGSHVHEGVPYKEQTNGYHSDNELNSRGFPPRIIKHEKLSRSLESQINLKEKSGQSSQEGLPSTTSNYWDDPLGIPPEWTPSNVSVPLLNLVDKIFMLNRRGWLRRQVFWISKQILQLVMEDAIDDFLLRQIHWLRREDIIALGIRWLQDILWPGGTFFIKLRNTESVVDDTYASQIGGVKVSKPGSYEQEFEATRRAKAVEKILFDEVPTALVGLIGQKQYRRCARDMFYFLQSSICIKQLTFEALELLLVSVFPELQDLVLDIHEKMPIPQP